METKDLIKYLESTCWNRKWVSSENDKFSEDWEYERSYADFIYDELTVWKEEKRITVMYNDINWGYTNYENYNFTYEEFIEWDKEKY